MVTKWKGWTALPAVKVISFILIIALCLLMVKAVVDMAAIHQETHIGPDVVFADLSDDQHFFSRYMVPAIQQSDKIISLQSEAAIRAGAHIRWESYYESDEWFWHSDALHHPDVHSYVRTIWDDEYRSPEERARMEEMIIREQLSDFRWTLEELASTEGLLYYLRDGRIQYSNVPWMQRILDTFTVQPVYFAVSENTRPEASHAIDAGWWAAGWWPPWPAGATIFLAFTPEVVAAHAAAYAAAQAGYIRNLQIIIAAGLLLLPFLFISLLGAGRRRGEAGVHFSGIDRPYLDVSLAAVIAWTALVLILVYQSLGVFGFQRANAGQFLLTALLFAAAVLLLVPAGLWLLSFAKRVKAGGFWRHTLLFSLLRRSGHLLLRTAKSLWAGAPLTAKVGIIAAAAFFTMLFIGLLSAGSRSAAVAFLLALFATAVVTFFLLRYANRIYKLEQGLDQAVEQGNYEQALDVGGGELGNIADSVKAIFSGFNRAVEERMKSERLKTELITNVSHDIRTPLTSLITYTDLLKQEGLISENAPGYLDVLIQKSQRLKTLTDELFEASKAATGNIEVNIRALDFVSLMDQVLGELDGAVKSSDLDLRVNLPERLFILADGKLLWRVMENLMSNVFKYALPGSRVYLDSRKLDALVCIELKNISAAELNVDPVELTERFKRGDDSRTEGGGAGLGLSIAQSFVSAQGGKFTISIDGDLFKATVCLPAADSPPD